MKAFLTLSSLLVLLSACAPPGSQSASGTISDVDCDTLRDSFGIDSPEEAMMEGRQDCAEELSQQDLATLISEEAD